MSSSESADSEYLTRTELAVFLTARGFPISLSTLDKLCAPACGRGPPLVGVWGGKGFYDPDGTIAWARARFGANELRRSRRET